MSELKKSIDNYIKGELLIGFEKDVSKAFAQEFIKIFGYEILNDSRYQKLKYMLIKIPKGQEYETIDVLKDYKKIIKFAELNGIVKGAGKNQSSKRKTLECSVCHEKIKKGEMHEKIIGEEEYLCMRCSATSFCDLIYKRNIASLDEVPKNKKKGD